MDYEIECYKIYYKKPISEVWSRYVIRYTEEDAVEKARELYEMKHDVKINKISRMVIDF